jgi:hypothetical protein
MVSQLRTASDIIGRGVFDVVPSFAVLEQRSAALGAENTKILGDAFEIFIEAYLATHPREQADEIHIVSQIPEAIRAELNLPNNPNGIDGAFTTRAGGLVPYQVKFRTNRPNLTYTEVFS